MLDRLELLKRELLIPVIMGDVRRNPQQCNKYLKGPLHYNLAKRLYQNSKLDHDYTRL